MLWTLAVAAWRRGDGDRASRLLKQALRLGRNLNDRLNGGMCLQALSWVAIDSTDARRAAMLMGAAEGASRSVGGASVVVPSMVVFKTSVSARSDSRWASRPSTMRVQRVPTFRSEILSTTRWARNAPALEAARPGRRAGRQARTRSRCAGGGRPHEQGDRSPFGDLAAHRAGPRRASAREARIHLARTGCRMVRGIEKRSNRIVGVGTWRGLRSRCR